MTVMIHRRHFLQSTTATLALSALGADGPDIVAKPRRVGLIGAGWYGKSDLWRLIQVAPVEVVSICDADTRMLAEAVEIAGQRLEVAEAAAHLRRLPGNAQGAGFRHRAHRLARSLARLADDRRCRGRGRRLRTEADLGGRPGR